MADGPGGELARLLMSRSRRLSAWTIAWCLCGLVCALLGCSGRPAGYGSGEYSFPVSALPEELDLGTIWATDSFFHTLHLTNVSSREVEIVDIRATCGCTSISPSSLTIQPGATSAVTLKLRVPDRPNDAQLKEWKFHTELVPIVRCPASSPRWELTGTIRRSLSLSPSSISFDGALIHGKAFPFKTVRLVAVSPLHSLEAQGGDAYASLDLKKESATEYVLRIQPRESLSPGPFRFDVKLTPRLPSGEKVTDSTLTVDGYVNHEVEPSPRSIQWGVVPTGRTLESRVVIRSVVGKRFTVESVTANSDRTKVQIEKCGDDVRLVIRSAVVDAGDHEDRVVVAVRNHNGKTFELAIPISYRAFVDKDHE